MSQELLAAELVRLSGLMLGAVDAILRAMAAEGVPDPPTALRLVAVRNPALPPDTLSLRYGPMLAAIRATYQFRGNDVLVETAIEKCIEIVESLW